MFKQAQITKKINQGIIFAAAVCTLYWLFIASDIYVSEAHVVVQKTELPGAAVGEMAGILSGMFGSNGNADQMMLVDYLQSLDLILKLDKRLGLRKHYSDKTHDFVSRLWRHEAEWFQVYFQKHAEIYYDKDAGILKVRVQAYDAKFAQKIAQALVIEGELFVNETAHKVATDQVRFLETQVAKMKHTLIQSRRTLLDYQNAHGLISPQASVESLAGTIAQLEVKRIELEAQIGALRSYLVADHPSIMQLEQQVSAINQQISKEQSKLVSNGGKTLNAKVEEYQRLEFEAGFAEEVYKTALAALERGRIDASRTLKKIIVVQSPNLPEYPLEPRRIYNAFVSLLLFAVLFGIVQLIIAIIQEHKD